MKLFYKDSREESRESSHMMAEEPQKEHIVPEKVLILLEK
jgi:hypothetical protein